MKRRTRSRPTKYNLSAFLPGFSPARNLSARQTAAPGAPAWSKNLNIPVLYPVKVNPRGMNTSKVNVSNLQKRVPAARGARYCEPAEEQMAKNVSTSQVRFLPIAEIGKRAQDLLQCSIEARKASYSPYSNFAVGAALLCENDKIYQGCNVENASYGISICAEQTAIVKAVSDGNTNFKAIAISADSPEITTPCGRCRQFIYEFGGEIRVYCAKPDLKEVLVALSSDLLPSGFNAM